MDDARPNDRMVAPHRTPVSRNEGTRPPARGRSGNLNDAPGPQHQPHGHRIRRQPERPRIANRRRRSTNPPTPRRLQAFGGSPTQRIRLPPPRRLRPHRPSRIPRPPMGPDTTRPRIRRPRPPRIRSNNNHPNPTNRYPKSPLHPPPAQVDGLMPAYGGYPV